MKIRSIVLSIALLAVLIVACAPAAPSQPAAAPTQPAVPVALTKVSLQLQWVTQSQFAGYFAAVEKEFYKDEGLDVTIKQGGPDIAPAQVVSAGGAEFGVGWLPGRILAAREQGAKLVSIAQVFQRSGTLEISWKDTGITKPQDWKGKKVGSWLLGNEPEVFAAMLKVGINPDNKNDVTIVKQPFDMNLFLNREIDAAEAENYNEYAQVLEAVNPKTGKLYTPDDLNVIDFNQVGTAMLQDGIMAREDWLADPKNQDVAVRFLRASYKGWIFCRDNLDECVQVVLKNGPTLGKGHMTWQLNEINALIWPSPKGIGMMDPDLYKQTIDIAVQYKVLTKQPDPNAYRTDLAQKALDSLGSLDTKGVNYKKQTIQVTRGGD